MNNLIYQNYHRHSTYTNPRISDSVATNEDYAKRAVEFGHGILSSCEHGWQGRYIESFELAQKYNLKFLFSTEAYWVKDRKEKDRTNCHIFIAAKNENGRQSINDILSEANITGFYAQPRLDIDLILSLPPQDVIVTTACIAYWKYDDIDDITVQFKNHFKNNFYLEVQYHNTESQRNLNKHILDLSKEHKIPIIMGCDSHYINETESQERNNYLVSKGIIYEDEEGWMLDYPDGNIVYERFANQCILNHNQILNAIQNTNIFLEIEEYSNPCFTKDIKMPTLYPNATQKEKDQIYLDLIWNEWNKEKNNIDQNKWLQYETEIKKETDIVIQTKHSDYFLVDHAIVKRGKEKGGIITPSGRGSGVSFYTNKLLGFTDIDRIAAKVKMYPERFMSPTRILETKSLADLDLNLGTVSIFAEAQKEIFGEEHSYPMLAYGTLKPKAAWKMYAKSQDVEFTLANQVSEQIEKYEQTIKHVGEDEKEGIQAINYIDNQYHEIYKQSEKYQGVISDWKIAPCGYLLYQGNIRKEIGLVKIKNNLCCLMDGKWAEDYKFLKNDLLRVSVVELIDKTYKRIGIQKHSVNELISLCTPDNKVWDIYKNGCTLGINQVEQPATRHRVMKYKPRNISELCAFVAAIRPGFKSMYNVFESREHFEYGIKSFDELIQTPDMPNTFVLYQEMSMATLNYAGIPMSECYEIIKNIAKKRVEKVLKYKEQFINGFTNVLIEKENQSKENAEKLSIKIWQILEDSSRYAFNSSHSYCVAVDSLYGAYLKTYYPIQFYETFLTILEADGDKTRMKVAKEEAEEYYNIKFPPFGFRQDNRNIVGNIQDNQITNCLSSIKGFGSNVADALYALKDKDYQNFIELLIDLNNSIINKTQIETLIKIDYFKEFGNIIELLQIKENFDILKQGNAKQWSKEKVPNEYIPIIEPYVNGNKKDGTPAKSYKILDMNGLLIALEKYIYSLQLNDLDLKTKMKNQLELLGYIDLTTNNPEDRQKLLITDVRALNGQYSDKPWGYAIFTKSIGTGKSGRLTVKSKLYKSKPIKKMDLIYIEKDNISKNKRGYWDLYGYEFIA